MLCFPGYVWRNYETNISLQTGAINSVCKLNTQSYIHRTCSTSFLHMIKTFVRLKNNLLGT